MIFSAQYINTAFMQVLSTANFEDTPLSFIPFVNQKYKDFDTDFYVEIGPILTQTMLIQSVLPFVNLFLVIGLNLLLRYLDSGNTMFDEVPKTKMKNILHYIQNVAGPEVELDI